jgi:hypothetical protein
MTRNSNARIAGLAYLFYIVVGLSNEVLSSRAMSGEGITAKLARINEYSTDVRLAVILKLCECFSAVVLGIALYGITRDEDGELAILGLVCRVAEGLFIASLIPTALGLLSLASVQTGSGGLDVRPTSALGLFLQRPDGLIGAIFFAVGSAIFSYLMLRGRMVPVSLAWWGLLSSAVLVIGLPLQLAGFFTGRVTGYQWGPALVFAPVLALWLLIKGVAPTPRRGERLNP